MSRQRPGRIDLGLGVHLARLAGGRSVGVQTIDRSPKDRIGEEAEVFERGILATAR